jgi:TonB family protein
VSRPTFLRKMAICLLGVGMSICAISPARIAAQAAQEEITRKVKTKTQPVYPELAKRMNISGTVKLQVVVAPNGTVKSAKIVGGHPLLANSSVDAVKKWRFEAGPEETTGLVELKFSPAEQ